MRVAEGHGRDNVKQSTYLVKSAEHNVEVVVYLYVP